MAWSWLIRACCSTGESNAANKPLLLSLQLGRLAYVLTEPQRVSIVDLKCEIRLSSELAFRRFRVRPRDRENNFVFQKL